MNAITTSNHDNGNGDVPSVKSEMTEAEMEAIVNDAEFISVLLSEKGPRHMIGALNLALAAAYVALPEDYRAAAVARQGELFVGSLEIFEKNFTVN